MPSPLTEIIERVERARESQLAPFELAEAASRLIADRGVAEAAQILRMSERHAQNLARLRRQLGPCAWARFCSEGHRAVLRDWLKIAALPATEQSRVAEKFPMTDDAGRLGHGSE